jgi:hypothetical protein
MSSSGSNVHSLTASKAKKKEKKKDVCATGPAISIGLLMIIAAIRYLRRIWVRGEKKGADYTAPRVIVVPLPCFSTEKSGQSGTHTHTSRGEIGYTHQTSQRKSLPFIRVFWSVFFSGGRVNAAPASHYYPWQLLGMGLGYYYHHHLLLDSRSRRWLPLVWVPYWTETAGQPLKAWPTGNFAYAFPISYSERFNQVFRTQRDSTLEK